MPDRSPATARNAISPTRPRRPAAGRLRDGHRREYNPGKSRIPFQERTERALVDIATYRSVSLQDLANVRFGGHPYTTRRAVNAWIRDGLVREHTAQGPKGKPFTVLTLTKKGSDQARRLAPAHGLDSHQRTWSGLVKRPELAHDTAVYRAAQREADRLSAQGASITRIRIDAELKREVAQTAEKARTRDGKAAADAARLETAKALHLPIREGRVLYPDAQLEYRHPDGRQGRVQIEIASGHYRARSLAAKTQAGFRVYAGRPAISKLRRLARAFHDRGGRGGGPGPANRHLAIIEL